MKDDDLLGHGALNKIADLVEILVPFVSHEFLPFLKRNRWVSKPTVALPSLFCAPTPVEVEMTIWMPYAALHQDHRGVGQARTRAT